MSNVPLINFPALAFAEFLLFLKTENPAQGPGWEFCASTLAAESPGPYSLPERLPVSRAGLPLLGRRPRYKVDVKLLRQSSIKTLEADLLYVQ